MGARSIFAAMLAGAVSANLSDFAASLHGGGRTLFGGDLGSFHYRAAAPFTWSTLRTSPTGTGATGRQTKTFLNGVQQTLGVTLPDAATLGDTAVDNVNAVSVAVGDKVQMAYRRTANGSGNAWSNSSVIIAPNDKAITPMLATSAGTTVSVLSTRRLSMSGTLAVSNTASQKVGGYTSKVAGTWRGLFGFVSANASTGSAVMTVTGHKAGAATAMTFSVGVGETGYFLDDNHPVTVAIDEDIDLALSGTVTGLNVTLTGIGSTFISDDRHFDVFDYHTRSFNTAAGTMWLGITGGDPGSTAPASASKEYVVEFPLEVDMLRFLATNTYDQAVTVVLCVDGVESALKETIAAGASAIYSVDATHLVQAAIGQKLVLKAYPAAAPTSGTFAFNNHALRFRDRTPAFKPKVRFNA